MEFKMVFIPQWHVNKNKNNNDDDDDDDDNNNNVLCLPSAVF